MNDPSFPDGVTHVELRSGAYADSVALLQVSKDVAAVPGVRAAQVAMATGLNLDVIASMGFTVPESTPNDMIVAIWCESADDVEPAIRAVDSALAAATRRPQAGEGEAGEGQAVIPRTTGSAITRSDASLALVSVPGAHASVEAADALDRGRDVMIFSDNVPVDEEVALKRMARDRGLLVMGPDCGTAMIGGVGLGFANAVHPGPVGIVAASGTGCQQLMCLLDHAGVGVSAALGVGGRDLSAEVGAMATRQAMQRLDADPDTELIVVVSKPPALEVGSELRALAGSLSTPVEFALLGPGQPDLTAAAETVLKSLGHDVPVWPTWGTAGDSTTAGSGPAPGNAPAAGHFLRGLFVGGTLCDESMLIASDVLGPLHSNTPFDAAHTLGESMTADAHLMIDFGDDSLTTGRAHPMIDPSLRLDYLAGTAKDPKTSVILLDVVLGHGAEPDPAAALAPAIRTALTDGSERGLSVIVACVGTALDPQDLGRQAAALAEAGAEVFLSNAQAARRATTLIG